jgi:hypothetical protein
MGDDEHLKVEFVPERPESDGGDPHYTNDLTYVVPVKEQTTLSIIGLILAIPFPILIIVLWATLSAIKGQAHAFGPGTMNAVVLYLLQFFVVPLLTITSIIIACIVTLKSKEIAKKIGYISFGITGVGFVILGLFLNHS